jgi:hypothetical protein
VRPAPDVRAATCTRTRIRPKTGRQPTSTFAFDVNDVRRWLLIAAFYAGYLCLVVTNFWCAGLHFLHLRVWLCDAFGREKKSLEIFPIFSLPPHAQNEGRAPSLFQNCNTGWTHR